MAHISNLCHGDPIIPSHLFTQRFHVFRLCSILTACLFSGGLIAQNTDPISQQLHIQSKPIELINMPVAEHFRGKVGLPTTINIFDANVDRRGYTWFSSAAGVSCYNGYEFTNYDVDDGLSDRTAIRSYEDYKGRMWFTSISGRLSIYDNGKMQAYKYNDVISPYLNKDRLASIHLDSSDVLHIGTYKSGYITVSPTGQLKKIITDSIHKGIGIVWVNDSVPLCFTDGSDSYLGHIAIFSKKIEKKLELNLEQERGPGIFSKTIRCITLADKSLLLSFEDLLIKIAPNGESITQRFSENIISILQDSYGGIWVSVRGSGVYHHPEGLLSTGKAVKYLEDNVSSIEEDLERGIWLTTTNNSVYYLPTPYISSVRVDQVFEKSPYSRDRIEATNYLDGEVYLLSKRGILMYSDSQLAKTVDLQQNFNEKNRTFSSIYPSPKDQSLWIGSYQEIQRLRGSELQMIGYHNSCPDYGSVNDILYNFRQKNFWATKGNVLIKMSDNGVDTCIEGFSNILRCLHEDDDGTLWIGATDGLWTYKNEKITYLGEADTLLKDVILEIRAFGGSLWMHNSVYGLVRLNHAGESSIIASDYRSFQLAHAFYIRDSSLWFISNGYLNKLSLDDKSEAVTIQELKLPTAIWKGTKDMIVDWQDHLTIAGGNRIYQFQFLPEFNSTPEIPLHISHLKINNSDTNLQDEYTLRYNQNHLAIKYVAITNLEAKDTKYKYRIKDVDPGWIETYDRQVQYTYLPAGTHVFEVYAKPLNGPWTSKPVRLTFAIGLPYWKTWWFISLCIMAGILAVTAAVRYRFKQLRRRNQLEMALNESQQQAFSARMNPHFIFNALNSIKTYVLENDVISSNDYIARFGKLMRQILDQSQYTLVPLVDELAALDNYVNLELMRGKGKFTYEQHIDPSIDLEKARVPSLLLQPLIENAIWHGVMPMDRPGIVRLRINMVQDHIECIIEDNGVGREQSKTENHNSASTSMLDKRLKLINARFKTNIKVQFADLTDDNGNATGTRVIIPLPLEFGT